MPTQKNKVLIDSTITEETDELDPSFHQQDPPIDPENEDKDEEDDEFPTKEDQDEDHDLNHDADDDLSLNNDDTPRPYQ